MAIKAILLGKKLRDAKAKLEALKAKDADFEAREAFLAQALEEMTEESTEEERAAVEEDVNALEAEQKAHNDAKAELERTIEGLEKDLAAEEAAQNTDPSPEVPAEEEQRKETKNMNTRDKIFAKMSVQERTALFEREDVKAFLAETRSCIREKRALTNVGLTIPTVLLPLLRENVFEYSKLYKHVSVSPVNGEGRVVIQGTIAEAVWTDCCANLNELDLGFNDMEMGCWRVGGFYAICNANIEDSDIDLAAEIIVALGQGIGLALDKAILYGTGTRMPLGVITRLVQTSQPAGYPATARPWVDLHTSNVKTIASTVTGIDLFRALVIDFAAAKGKYSRGQKVFAMNETTYAKITAAAMSVDAAGAIVAGVNGRMPVVGGIIEVLDFIQDDVIFAGYFDLYKLAERGGQQFASSEHVKFLQDQTVFKGTARYDGGPAIAEGFVVIGIDGATPSASMSFPGDGANTASDILLTSTASVAVGATLALVPTLLPLGTTTEITWSSGTEAKATVSTSGVVTGVATGSSVITAKLANGKTATCTVTVTSA
ncbi:MAG: phage major capsid protein [Firmicutes bacterium]|nr:phage major capsid protein [Bacillota bacterium]